VQQNFGEEESTFTFFQYRAPLGYWHQRADERHGNPPPSYTGSY